MLILCICHPLSTHLLPHEPAAALTTQAAAAFAAHLAAASPAAATALAGSGLVGALAALLEAPSTQISPNSKLDALGFFRQAASRAPIRDAVRRPSLHLVLRSHQPCTWAPPLGFAAA